MTKIPVQRDSAKCAIVVPVYNVAPYLSECLNSILAQTYTNFTVFAVDDGSTDESGEILDRYSKSDQRILVLHTANQGVSAARNVALEHIEASGIFDYIAFVDSDDTISRSMLKSLVSEAQTRNADLVTGAFSSFDSNGKTYVKGALFPSHRLTKENYLSLIFSCGPYKNLCGRGGMVWKCLYKAQTIQGLRFEENWGTCEDEVYSTRVALQAKAIYYIPEILYFYRWRTGSLANNKQFDLQLLDGRHKAFVLARELSEEAALISSSSYMKAILSSAKKQGSLKGIRVDLSQFWLKKTLASGLVDKKRVFQWYLLTNHPSVFSCYCTLRRVLRPNKQDPKKY